MTAVSTVPTDVADEAVDPAAATPATGATPEVGATPGAGATPGVGAIPGADGAGHGDDAGRGAHPRGGGRAPAVGRGERIVLALGFVALAAAVVGTRWGVFAPDTRPDLYEQPGRFVRESLNAWVGGATGLGQGNFNAGAAPVGVVVWLIRTLGAPAWLAVRIWRLLLLVVAAWGIRRYLDGVVGDRLTPSARLVATVFWVANPYVIVAGNTTPILLPYALLPWTLLAFVRAARSGGWRWPAVFGLTFFLQSGLNAGVVPFFQLLALPAHLLHLRYVEHLRWRRLLGTLLRCGALSVLVSLYWLAPSMVASGTGASIASSTERPADVARTSSYAESARGLGLWSLYGRAGDRLYLGGYTVYLTSRLVLLATLTTTVAVGAALHRARSRLRLLVVGLLVTALPVMVGLFPGPDPYPAGRILGRIFDTVPATLAFRTTNKIGAVLVLGTTLALTLGTVALGGALARRRRPLRLVAGTLVVAVLVGIATPMWNGSLYPLGYRVPDRWHDAMDDLDAAGDGRVLVVPGGTGGNYRWGMRSPDDLFPSHLDRPVVSRNTVVGAGDPAGNFLTWFDTDLQQGVLPAEGISTVARYLGADRVLVRSDVLSEETEGARPAVVAAAADADPGLTPLRTYGRPGTDTVPGSAGAATAQDRALDPADAALPPLSVLAVRDPRPQVTVADAADLVLVDGDAAALSALTDLGLLAGSPPLRYLGDLDADQLARAVDAGARLVLTDTNQRRAWDINRLRNASGPVLRADEDLDAGSGPSLTLWPDEVDRQTVADLGPQVRAVTSHIETFGIRPWGKPTALVDGNETTTFWTGGIFSPLDGSVDVDLARPTPVTTLAVKVNPSEPARITALAVEVAGQRHEVEVPPGGGWVGVPVDGADTGRIRLTITGVTAGANPVGIDEVAINEGTVRAVDQLVTPRTAEVILDGAEPAAGDALRERLATVPTDVVLSRLTGEAGQRSDDEEALLNRRISLPVARTFGFRARLHPGEIDRQVLAAARAGDARCLPVAELDGEPLLARIVSLDAEGPAGSVAVEGCDVVDLDAGSHDVRAVFGWRLERIHLQSVDAGSVAAGPNADADGAAGAPDGTTPAPAVGIDATAGAPGELRFTVPAGSGERYLRTGIGWDPRWRLRIDGEDQGPPITVDGYAVGWPIGPEGGEAVVTFPPQRAVDGAFVVSAAGVAATVTLALWPGAPLPRRRRDEDDPPGGGDDDGDGGGDGDGRDGHAGADHDGDGDGRGDGDGDGDGHAGADHDGDGGDRRGDGEGGTS